MRAALFLLLAWGALLVTPPFDLAAGRGSGRTPQVVFDATTIDFGTVFEGDGVTCVLRCRNVGREEIRLVRSQGSCGCVALVAEPGLRIPAGGARSIQVRFRTEARVGPQRPYVKLWTDEGDEPIVVRLKGFVERVASLEPRAVHAEVAAGEEREAVVRLRFLREVRCPGIDSIGALLRVDPDWESGVLRLRIRAPTAPGPAASEVVVGFDIDGRRHRVTVPVLIAVREGKP